MGTAWSKSSLCAEIEDECSDTVSTVPSEGEVPLVAFSRSNQTAAAFRELQRLEALGADATALLDDASLERIRRIGLKFIEGERLLSASVSSLQIHEKNHALGNLEWGVSISETGEFVQMASCEYDHDVLTGIAVRAEKDLSTEYVCAEQVGDRTSNDAVWRLVKNIGAIRTEMDDVSYESFVDALDEPMQAIFYASYTPPAGATSVLGLPIPPVKQGCVRAERLSQFMKLEPLRRGPDGTLGYRCTAVLKVQFPALTAKIVRALPSWLIRRGMRSFWEGNVAEINALHTGEKLADRLRSSPQAELYRGIRHHLAQTL